MKVRIAVITDGKRWRAHGESGKSDSHNLGTAEFETDPQWETNLDRDMICVVEADIPYAPNRVQAFKGNVARIRDGRKRKS